MAWVVVISGGDDEWVVSDTCLFFCFLFFLQVVEYVRNHHDDVNVSTAWQKVVVFWYTTHHSCFLSSLSLFRSKNCCNSFNTRCKKIT